MRGLRVRSYFPRATSSELRRTCTFADEFISRIVVRVAGQTLRAGLLAIALLAIGCGATTGVLAPASTELPTPSPVAVVTSVPSVVAPTLPPRTPTPVTPSPRPAPPAASVIPPPQTRVGPTPTWTATPNSSIPPGVNGCVSNRAYHTTDCVARNLPPGASVVETVNEGGRTFVVDWLPPVDANGNVPFPYERPGPGTTTFTTSAGGVVVTFEVTFL
jgi:hypothetical protein